MPVYDMKCPRCGKQSTEYDENKWQCLHCGNRFVYKEESPTYQSQTNVSIQGSSLFDVEPYDPGNEQPIEEPYLKVHSLGFDEEWAELDIREGGGVFLVSFPLVIGLTGFFGGGVLLAEYHINNGKDSLVVMSIGAFIAGIIGAVYFVKNFMIQNKTRLEKDEREAYLETLKESVGWIALCPSCKEEHSQYRNEEKDPTSGPVHCKSCGKQFMLLDGKAHAIKH